MLVIKKQGDMKRFEVVEQSLNGANVGIRQYESSFLSSVEFRYTMIIAFLFISSDVCFNGVVLLQQSPFLAFPR